MSLQWLGILVIALLFCAGGADGANFKIGVNLPFQTSSLGTAVTNLVKFLQVNEVDLATIDQTGTHTFSLVYTATNYTARNATLAIQDAISTHNVLGVVGDWTSSMTIPQSLAGSKTFTWMCSGAASSSVLSDKNNHAFFFRTMCDDPSQGRIIAQFVKSLGWGTASVIASSDAYGQSVSGSFLTMARTLGIQVTANQVFQPGQADYSVALDAVLNSGSQIIVLSALADSSLELLRQAKARGMISPEWVWIGPENMASFADLNLTPEEKENIDGMLYVYPREKTYTARFNTSLTRFKTAYPSEEIPAYSFLFNDCVEALARGILKIAQEKSVADLYNRNYFPNLTHYFLNSFEGLTGRIDYDALGNRKAYFNVFNIYKSVSTPVYDVLPDLSVVQRTPITFFGGTKTIPRDRPQQTPLVAYLDSPTGVGLAAGNGIVIAIIAFTWIYLFAARHQPSVRSLSFPFLSLICLGCVLVLASNIAALGSPTAMGCQTSLWLFCWGLELVLASSAAKAYRLWKIFDNRVISAGKVGNKYLLAGVLGIILGQTIILIIWTAGGPQQAIMVSSRTYYFFRCESAVAAFNSALSAVTIVYNFILLAVLLFLAYKTRGIASNFKESTWMFYTGQNVLLTGIVVAAFAFFSFGDSSLAAFIVKQVTIIYSVAFAFAALVGRIAVAVYATSGFSGLSKLASSVAVLQAGKDNQGSSTRGGAMSTQTPGGEANMKVSMIDGTTRISSVRGTYPVKKVGGLMSTWISHNVGFHGADGFFSLIPAKVDPELGVILRLNTIHFDPAPTGMKACIEVSSKGKGWMIQFSTDEEREKWVSVLATTSTSKKGSTTGGAGATAASPQSGSPLRASPSEKLGSNSKNALG